jgi:hypothetical protein
MLTELLTGGMGLKGLLDAARERKQKQAQAVADAAAMQFSPWSGINVNHLAGKDYSAQDPLSGLAAGGISGAMTGMNIENSKAEQMANKKKAAYYQNLLPPGTGDI